MNNIAKVKFDFEYTTHHIFQKNLIYGVKSSRKQARILICSLTIRTFVEDLRER